MKEVPRGFVEVKNLGLLKRNVETMNDALPLSGQAQTKRLK
jgi:hypothetical protein